MKETRPVTPPAAAATFRRDEAGERELGERGLSRVRGRRQMSGGRLDRRTLMLLGKTLDAYVGSLRAGGVPDRFRRLLDEYLDKDLDEYDERQTFVVRGMGGAENEGQG